MRSALFWLSPQLLHYAAAAVVGAAAAAVAAGIGGIPCRSCVGIPQCERYGSWRGCASDTPDCVATPIIFMDSTTKYLTTRTNSRKGTDKGRSKMIQVPVPMISTYNRCHLCHLPIL